MHERGSVLAELLEPGLWLVTLNRPERRNALGIELLESFCGLIEELAADSTHRVVIVRGAGPVFSAGLDLHEAAETDLVERSAAAVSRTLLLLRSTPLVMIAVVQGGAYAGGAGVMAACDIVIAAADAKFGFPEARRGLLPALISEVLLHRIREGDLRELFLAGEAVDAHRAQQIGLVQLVVPSSRLMDEALRIARAVLAGGPQTIRQTKLLLGELYRRTSERQDEELRKMHLMARSSAEAVEGLAAFAEKREPRW